MSITTKLIIPGLALLFSMSASNALQSSTPALTESSQLSQVLGGCGKCLVLPPDFGILSDSDKRELLGEAIARGDFGIVKMLFDKGVELPKSLITMSIDWIIDKQIPYVKTSPLFAESRAEKISAYEKIRDLLRTYI